MRREEPLGRVGRYAGLGSAARAEEATRAVLEMLGECLSGGEAADLAAQLPEEIAEIPRREPPNRAGISSLQDFLQRVGKEENVGPREAKAHAGAVFSVLDEAVSGGEWSDVRRQFPSESDRLLG